MRHRKRLLLVFIAVAAAIPAVFAAVGFFSPGETGKYFGYISSIDGKGSRYFLEIDSATLLTGREAIEAMLRDGKCSAPGYGVDEALKELETADLSRGYGIFGECAPNGYYIRNTEPERRVFRASSGVSVVITPHARSENMPFSVLADVFSGRITARFDPELSETVDTAWMKSVPYWITLQDGRITAIEQQYLP